VRWILLAAGLSVASPALAASHEVVSGETLGRIGKLYGCTAAELKVANQLKSDRLQVGDILDVPTCTGRGRSHTVVKGEYLGKIAKKYGCAVEELRRANDLDRDRLQIGDLLTVPPCTGKAPKGPAPARKARAKRTAKRRAGKPPKLGKHRVDTKRLAKAMAKHGFHPPADFKMLVVEFTLDKGNAKVIRERPFSWRGTYDDTNFNAGSTVKFFAAVGALERLRALGFTPNAVATFHDRKGARKRKARVRNLVVDALVDSNNIAYNRLVQLAGYDRLNGRVLSAGRGMHDSGIHKPYERSKWVPMTGLKSFKWFPKIVVRQGKKMRSFRAGRSKKKWNCSGGGTCTSMRDLAENMRRLMLHEQIPARQRHNLGIAELRTIRRGLEKKRKRGMEVVRGIQKAFKRDQVHVYHKPGFAGEWFSDCLYIYKRRSNRRWVVALAGYPGRGALNSAAIALGKVLASEAL
jgi:LysM repeat protein